MSKVEKMEMEMNNIRRRMNALDLYMDQAETNETRKDSKKTIKKLERMFKKIK